MTPSIARVIWRDFLASVFAQVVVGTWVCTAGLELIGRVIGGQAEVIRAYGVPNLLIISCALTTLLGPALLLRVWMVRHVFQHGQATVGEVVATEQKGAVERVFVQYTVGAEQHTLRNAVKKTRRSLPVRKGDRVTVCVDSDNPRHGFVRELYVGWSEA